jgi:hypothetical protein
VLRGGLVCQISCNTRGGTTTHIHGRPNSSKQSRPAGVIILSFSTTRSSPAESLISAASPRNGAGTSSLRLASLTSPHTRPRTVVNGVSHFAQIYPIFSMPLRRSPTTVCDSCTIVRSCIFESGDRFGLACNAILFLWARVAPNILILAPESMGPSGNIPWTALPCSSCEQSVSRNRSTGSRPTRVPRNWPPSIVHESPDSKKS